MKFIIVALAVVATMASGAFLKPNPKAEFPLLEAFQELSDILHLKEARAATEKYQNDPEILKILAYLSSDNFKAAVKVLNESKELVGLIKWVDGEGVKIIAYITGLAAKYGWDVSSIKPTINIEGHSWESMVDEILGIVGPHLDDAVLHVEILVGSNVPFRHFIVQLVALRGELLRLAADPAIQQVNTDVYNEFGMKTGNAVLIVSEFMDFLENLIKN